MKHTTKFSNQFVIFIFLILTYSCADDSVISLTQIHEGNFISALPIPSTINPQNLTLEAKPSPWKFLQDLTTKNSLLYNSTLPVIKINSGDLFNVNFKNELNNSSNIHWHGVLTPAKMDGHPKDLVAPGSNMNYAFKIKQRAATLWFHPHPHMETAEQAYMGLAGMFIVNDDEEKSLQLPSGEFEIPLVFSDKKFNEDGTLRYALGSIDKHYGYLGDKMLVNYTESPYLNVKTKFYRFRMLNGSNARIFDIALSNGASYYVIGNDGGLLEKPVMLTHALLSPGERLDVLIDFSRLNVGDTIYLQNNSNTIEGYGEQSYKILRFIVTEKENEVFSIPGSLSSITNLNPANAARTRIFRLPAPHSGHSGMHMDGSHTINGLSYDISRIDESVKAGDIEIWEFDNSMGMDPHPMHIHGVQFQIIDKMNGNLEEYEKGWKDTVLLKKGEKVRVIMQFPNEKGIFLVHCHNLEHEDDGMMLNFQIQ